jgi:hypothetical protein
MLGKPCSQASIRGHVTILQGRSTKKLDGKRYVTVENLNEYPFPSKVENSSGEME